MTTSLLFTRFSVCQFGPASSRTPHPFCFVHAVAPLPVKAFWNLPLVANTSIIAGLSETDQSLRDTAVRQRRLELARKAFREFYAQCFWSYREDAEITEDKIAFVIRGLREHGGLAGYRIAAELCL